MQTKTTLWYIVLDSQKAWRTCWKTVEEFVFKVLFMFGIDLANLKAEL